MKHSHADVLASYLFLCGMFTNPEVEPGKPWNMWVNGLDDDVDQAGMISDIHGIPEGKDQRSGESLFKPGIQIMVRSTNQQDAWQRIFATSVLLDSINRQTFVYDAATYMIHGFKMQTSIAPLRSARQDNEIAQRRFVWVFNGTVTIEDGTTRQQLPRVATSITANGPVYSQTPVGTIDGANKVFTLTAYPESTVAYMLFRNGVLQVRSITGDYTKVDTTITFNTGKQPQSGDVLSFVWINQ